jgi:fermentation-respiration switch protein FrsA (DUF1100 family)
VKRVLATLGLAALLGYGTLAGLVWAFQERLLFFPQPAAGNGPIPAGWTREEVRIAMRDGVEVAGVLLRPPGERASVVIYFGGNAEEVTAWTEDADRFGARARLLVNYRGYGRSAGSPSQEKLVADGLEIHDWAARHPALDAARIALHGRSLGTGVAVQVAAARPVRCVVLVSAYDSVREVARGFYPWLPVTWILRHPFDSAAQAPAMRVPALFLYGGRDTVIAKRHSERLARLWGGPVSQAEFTERDHDDIGLDPRHHEAIAGFLDRHL